jgi:hypothetical protein
MGSTIEWPSVQEVYEYRCQVREQILQLIEETPLELPIKSDDPFVSYFLWVVFLFQLRDSARPPLPMVSQVFVPQCSGM